MDLIVDNYFPVLENIGEQMERVEAELLKSSQRKELGDLYQLKQEIIVIRQAVWPLRDMIGTFMKSEHHDISSEVHEYLRDVYDHMLQVLEAVEIFREMASDMLGLYMSTNSQRLNEIMKVLTMFAAIFIPLTFIAGLYGMNFRSLPLLESEAGVFVVWGIMASLVIAMLIYFKVKKWL